MTKKLKKLIADGGRFTVGVFGGTLTAYIVTNVLMIFRPENVTELWAYPALLALIFSFVLGGSAFENYYEWLFMEDEN